MQEIELMDFPFHASDGSIKGKCGLPVWLFGGEVKPVLLHQVVVAYLANQRQGNASTRNRTAVKGGGRKPWRQKGTGRARSGSTRSPLWKGGGVIFGPTDRDYSLKVTKKMKKIALISALSIRAKENSVAVLEIPQLENPKTSVVYDTLRNIGLDGTKTLLLTNGSKSNVFMSSRNIPWLTVKPFEQVSCYDVLRARKVLIDKEIFEEDLKTGESDGLSQDH